MHLRKVWANIGKSSYPIYIGKGVCESIGRLMRDIGLRGKCAIVTNRTVWNLHGDGVEDALLSMGYDVYVLRVPDGEACKSLDVAVQLYEELINREFDRSSVILALGGGSIGDIAGFVAATYMRGINLVQVPTTLLAQVDAAIGGKVAINHPRGKNLIGTFYQPRMVLIDIKFLKSLSTRDIRSGLAEIVKYGAILNGDFFYFVKENWEKIISLRDRELLYAIEMSCRIKVRIVEKDERDERGIRALLNFGHTVGHALESAYHYSKLRHGEAVSIGMCYEALISVKMGLAKEHVYRELVHVLEEIGLPVRLSDDVDLEELIERMRHDKKSINGEIRMALPKDIGEGIFVNNVPIEVIREALRI